MSSSSSLTQVLSLLFLPLFISIIRDLDRMPTRDRRIALSNYLYRNVRCLDGTFNISINYESGSSMEVIMTPIFFLFF